MLIKIKLYFRTPSNSFGYAIASMVIFKKIKQAIGLDRCRNILSGAAPLSPEIQKYFFSIDIPLLEVNKLLKMIFFDKESEVRI